AGKRLGVIGEFGGHFQPSLSPDEATVAVDQFFTQADDIWLLPVVRGPPSRFTFNASSRPVWSADGSRIAFASFTKALLAKSLEGTGKEEVLLESGGVPDRRP